MVHLPFFPVFLYGNSLIVFAATTRPKKEDKNEERTGKRAILMRPFPFVSKEFVSCAVSLCIDATIFDATLSATY